MALFDNLKSGLARTREGFINGLDELFGDYSEVDEEFFDGLEELLILSDTGIETADRIVGSMKQRIYSEHLKKPEDVRRALGETISCEMRPGDDAYDFLSERSYILVVGVNGAGKTTTIGKLAYMLKGEGKKVLLAAADTYRAGASEQLRIWAERAGADFVPGKEGSDPASVIYEAADRFTAGGYDFLIADTAGRLHNKKNLMEELSKIKRILKRKLPDIRAEILLVLDAGTGQNALNQVREFKEASDITGIILTKLDGTAKGGVVIGINSAFDIPVKYIGTGEGIEDLSSFDPEEFIKALLSD